MVITLTTDFGQHSGYVAQMKGVILSINPAVTLVDISHAIPPQDIRQASLVLSDSARHFPNGTIHVAVVDPGVGTERRLLYARIDQQCFVAPDNGLLSLLVDQGPVHELIELTSTDYWNSTVSSTFHGRDIMAPVAAHLSRGVAPAKLGSPAGDLMRLDWSMPVQESAVVHGCILTIDTFGNLISNVARRHLPDQVPAERFQVRCGPQRIQGLVTSYGSRPEGTPVALWGSSGRLELAVVCGSAAQQWQIKRGDSVTISW